MWFNRSIATINDMLKFRYYEFDIYIYFNNFGFKIATLDPNLSFPLCKCTKIDRMNKSGSNRIKVDKMDRIVPK